MWKPGDRVTHRFHAELGPGRITAVQGRSLRVEFPDANQTLSFAAGTDALLPLSVQPGGKARLEGTNEIVVVESCEAGYCLLADGREVPFDSLWPLPAEVSPVERLARGNVDGFEDFATGWTACASSASARPAAWAHSSAGASRSSPPALRRRNAPATAIPCAGCWPTRWGWARRSSLLILNRLLHTGRAGRTLIVAPETLVLQWLGELWRKYHQVFVMLDDTSA